MAFITKLLLSEEPLTGVFYNSIIVIIDRLIKFLYYLPYRESIDTEELSYIFYRYIISVYRLLTEILSDRGLIFTAKFWQALILYLGLNYRLITAFRL
jgi:hypothetical protein